MLQTLETVASEIFWPTTWWAWAWMIFCIALVFSPRRFDPAIRLKEWTERKRHGEK
jgi:phosphatidylserine decarboxylase